MNKVKVRALRSGSSGNIYLLEAGSTRLILDCGVNGKQFASALAEAGISAAEIPGMQGILITHEHSDHISGLGVILRRYKLPVYMNRATYMAAAPRLGRFDQELLNFIEPGESLPIGDFLVKAFAISHDAADPQAYSFDTEAGKIAFCTDTGLVDDPIYAELQGSKLVFLESNYEPQLLEAGPYPWPLKQRIRGEHGHLSNQRAAELCSQLLETGTDRFVLSHLSQENNFPLLALQATEAQLSAAGAQENLDYQLYVANRYQVSEELVL